MEEIIKEETKLIHAHFFFVDIVGLSDPSMSTKNQVNKIEILKKCISDTDIFKATSKEDMLIDQHGDGMCIGFLQGPDLPLKLAIQLQQKLLEYNKGKIAEYMVGVRIGLNSGICYVVEDLNGRKTTWGPGIILAKRVMDFGDDGHILLTPNMAENLREISDDFKKIIKPVHDFSIKHGQSILVYSAYYDSFGNKEHPTKDDAQSTQLWDEIQKSQNRLLYPHIQVELSIIEPEKMLVQHKRTYEIQNKTDEPIKDILHGIATDVVKYSLDELNVQVYDEDGTEMKISSINVDKPLTKEFTTRFNKPIRQGQTGRKYTLIYEVEEPERYFENTFLIDSGKFTLIFKYPSGCKCSPKIYELNQETEEKVPLENQPKINDSGNYCIVEFVKEQCTQGETLGIEW